jgi:accessory gene regulator B
MINASSERVASFFVQNKIIEKEDSEVYAYGILLIISSVFNTLLLLTIGALLWRLTETIIFLFSFAVIRSFSGGYHAETYWKCIIYFLITYILNIVVYLDTR